MAWFLKGISVMAPNLRLSSLIPLGLVVDDITESETTLVVSARLKAMERACRDAARCLAAFTVDM